MTALVSHNLLTYSWEYAPYLYLIFYHIKLVCYHYSSRPSDYSELVSAYWKLKQPYLDDNPVGEWWSVKLKFDRFAAQ